MWSSEDVNDLEVFILNYLLYLWFFCCLLFGVFGKRSFLFDEYGGMFSIC